MQVWRNTGRNILPLHHMEHLKPNKEKQKDKLWVMKCTQHVIPEWGEEGGGDLNRNLGRGVWLTQQNPDPVHDTMM